MMTSTTIHGCLAWVHQAASRRGVILCGALDYEGLCTYRAWYQLAVRIAAAGCTALRFDYPGRGDSLDLPAGVGLVEAGAEAVRAAIDKLRGEFGVEEIVLVGLRFGCLVAMRAAAGRDDVHAIALLAPVASGRAYAREMAVQAKLMSADLPAGAVVSGLSVGGFALDEAEQAELKQIDLMNLADIRCRSMLVMQPAGRVDARLGAHLQSLGGAVRLDGFAGYDELMRNPTLSIEPAAFAEVARWAGDGAAAGGRQPARQQAVLAGPSWREEAHLFGEGRTLAGVLCRPAAAVAGAPTVLLTNAGRNPRSGWARHNTTLARSLAERGVASLRFDCAGFGDSDPVPPGVEPLYSPEGLADARAALDFLERHGHDQVVMVGQCSGANLAFHAAVGDRRLRGIVPVNLQRFIWHPRDGFGTIRSTDFYRRRLFDRTTWTRLLKGDIDVRGIAKGLVRRTIVRPVVGVAAAVGGRLGFPTQARRVSRWFLELEQRDVRILLVHTEDDPGMDELAGYFGEGAPWLLQRRGVSRRTIAASDHDLTPVKARQDLRQLIEAFLAVPETSAQGGDLAGTARPPWEARSAVHALRS